MLAMRWRLIPSWAKDKKALLINARADSVFTKPAFRISAKRRRCFILADGYYEWKTLGPKLKQPYYFRPADSKPIAFAGIWEVWNGGEEPVESSAIITTQANDMAAKAHDRMPVILRRSEADAWLDPVIEEAEKLAELPLPYAPRIWCFIRWELPWETPERWAGSHQTD
jgi:putative SOS response-associated peptidase YedK